MRSAVTPAGRLVLGVVAWALAAAAADARGGALRPLIARLYEAATEAAEAVQSHKPPRASATTDR